MNPLKQAEELARDPSTKVRAIKLYREITKQDLKTAKTAVEHFAEHGKWPDQAPEQEISLRDIEELIIQKKKVQAIKLFREQTAQSLMVSKLTVDYFADNGHWPTAPIEHNQSENGTSKDLPKLTSTSDGKKAIGFFILVFIGIGFIFFFIVS